MRSGEPARQRTSASGGRLGVVVDNNLSWRLAEALSSLGHWHVLHVRDLGLSTACDGDVMAAVIDQSSVLITRDGDFVRMLASSGHCKPSVIFFRSQVSERPAEQMSMLARALRKHASALLQGAIVVVEDHGTRVTMLPIAKS